MEITSPGRATLAPALKARSAELIRANNFDQAEQVQKDLVTLEKAPGENLYEMYRLASEKGKDYPSDQTYTGHLFSDWKGGAIVVGGAVGAFLMLVGSIPPAIPGLVYAAGGVLGAAGAVAVWGAVEHHQGSKNRAIMDAVTRNQDYLRNYSPATPTETYQIDRKVFLAGLVGKEARLAENGQFEKAVQMRQVHEKLSKLPGETVEDLFGALIQSQDRQTIDLVQGKCSQEIAETVETLAEVGKLVAPGTLNTVREENDSLVIGGVVLKKRAA